MVPIVPVVIVPVLTEHERVDSMLTSFDGFIIDLVVIDNGNHPTWEPRTSKASNIYHYRMPTNLGVAASWNLGIKATCKSAGWMIVNHDVGFGHNGVSDFFAQASPTNLVLGGKPPWSCFWLGSHVVQKVGLFHEGYHPAYFEDNDYEVRASRKGVNIVRSAAAINHRNSSTLQSSPKFQMRNQATFDANRRLFEERMIQDLPLDWDLNRRLELGWD
jgi:GT2 family glycosyltransferase